MPRPRNERQPRSKIFWDEKKRTWRCIIAVGTKPNGQPDRRYRANRDYDELVRTVLALEDDADEGALPPAGTRHRLRDWLDKWLRDSAPANAGYSTLEIRDWAIRLYLKPRLGEVWLDELTTEAVDVVYRSLTDEGLSSKSVRLIHETLKLALDQAAEYDYIRRNPAKKAKLPALVETEVEPLTADEAIAFLREASHRRNFLRWVLGFLGGRQGEVLGARWSDLERDQWLYFRGKAQYRKYRHGCPDPVACASKHCRTKPCEGPWQHGCDNPQVCAKPHCERPQYPSDVKRGIRQQPCPPGCTGHARGCPQRYRGPCSRKRHQVCPPLCEPGCTGHAKACPDRVGGILLEETAPVEVAEAGGRRARSRRATRRGRRLSTKTEAGTRKIMIPSAFKQMIEVHRARQREDAEAAGDRWQDNDLIVCDRFGKPIGRSVDWAEWTDILETAGIEHLPAHAARHTAATFLLALKVDRRIVMEIMGWKDERMLTRYQHVADQLKADAAELVGELLAGSSGHFGGPADGPAV